MGVLVEYLTEKMHSVLQYVFSRTGDVRACVCVC